jgi:phosphoribosylformimino-5-aminoimidazole carboxamide ribotide isomerase
MELIPAIDLLGGRCVRLLRGDFGAVTEYERDPIELASAYRAAGARRLHVVDLDGARTGNPANTAIIRRLAGDKSMAVQVGGGIRTLAAATALLAAGAERVVVGSIAVDEPDTVLDWLADLGVDRLVLAFDVTLEEASGDPIVVTHGWTRSSGRSLWELMDRYCSADARHFLCTDVRRDGTLAGANNQLYADCVQRYPAARIMASGGLSSASDIPALARTGVAAAITGKALLDGRLSLEELRQFSLAG